MYDKSEILKNMYIGDFSGLIDQSDKTISVDENTKTKWIDVERINDSSKFEKYIFTHVKTPFTIVHCMNMKQLKRVFKKDRILSSVYHFTNFRDIINKNSLSKIDNLIDNDTKDFKIVYIPHLQFFSFFNTDPFFSNIFKFKLNPNDFIINLVILVVPEENDVNKVDDSERLSTLLQTAISACIFNKCHHLLIQQSKFTNDDQAFIDAVSNMVKNITVNKYINDVILFE